MKFQVTRTSDWGCTVNPPCEGATLALDRSSICDSNIYTIELETLEDLIRFKEKVGKEIIITKPLDCEDISPLQIEIYDSYRE